MRGSLAQIAGRRNKTNQVLDQGLGDRRIGVVVRHLIANPVGAPSEAQLGEVAGPDHQTSMMVRQPEEIVGAQPGLDVFEGHVVEGFAGCRSVPDILQHLARRRANVDLRAADPERLHQPPGIGFRRLAGGKSGERVGEDIGARHSQPVHDPRRHDQRLG